MASTSTGDHVSRTGKRLAMWRTMQRSLVALSALFVLAPPAAFADKVWGPTPEDQNAMGSPLDALPVLGKMLGAGEINLCAFVGDLSVRQQVSAKATGRGVTITCGAAKEQYVVDYAAHALFGLDAMSGNDRIMFCESKDGAAIYAVYAKLDGKSASDKNACLESSTRNGRYKREVVRRFVTAWTIMSRGWAAPPPDEATIRDQVKTLAPITEEQLESLRRTQIQVELAIKENRLLDAAQLYRTALTAAPGWAAGHFNRALLMADLEFYVSAVWHMRTYLALSPDAPDARAARDKIYEWEARLPRPPQ